MNRHDIQVLQQVEGRPALTITLPTHRTSPDNRQDPIRVKNLVAQATERLLEEHNKRDIQPLLDRLEKLADEIDYRFALDGLVLFVTHDFAAKYYLPYSLPERVVVGETLFTRDLVFTLNRTLRYWVLVLSEQPTRLYEGTRDALVEVEGEGFPLTHEGPGGETALPGGFGVNVSAIRDERHRQFFRSIDAALTPFLADDPLPLVVVGVDRFLAFFDEISAHTDAVVATLNGSHDKTSAPELVELVWPLVKAGLAEQRQGYLADLDKAVGQQRVVSTPGEVWRLAQEGRGRLLLVEEDFHFAGRVDESGTTLTPADDPAAPGVLDDAVNDIIEMVLSKGGRVRFMKDGQLAAFQRMALTLRY